MLIKESHLRQIIRQILKESKLNQDSIVKVGVAVFTIQAAVVLAQAAIQFIHVIHDFVADDYCSLTGGVNFKIKDGKLNKEDIEEFFGTSDLSEQSLKGKLQLSVESKHSALNLVLKSLETGKSFKVQLTSASAMPPKSSKVRLHRKRVADVVCAMITGEYDAKAAIASRETESKLKKLLMAISGLDSATAAGFTYKNNL